jgi:hypothetical protein
MAAAKKISIIIETPIGSGFYPTSFNISRHQLSLNY